MLNKEIHQVNDTITETNKINSSTYLREVTPTYDAKSLSLNRAKEYVNILDSKVRSERIDQILTDQSIFPDTEHKKQWIKTLIAGLRQEDNFTTKLTRGGIWTAIETHMEKKEMIEVINGIANLEQKQNINEATENARQYQISANIGRSLTNVGQDRNKLYSDSEGMSLEIDMQKLEKVIEGIFSKDIYNSIIRRLNSEIRCLNKESNEYEDLIKLVDNIKIMYPNSKKEGDKIEALKNAFNFIKRERYGEGSRRGIDEKAIDTNMDDIMKYIKKQIPEKTLQALELSIDKVIMSSDTREEASLRNRINKIDDSCFRTFRTSIHPLKNDQGDYQEMYNAHKSIYTFYQGGLTTLTQFKDALKKLIPLLHKECSKTTDHVSRRRAYTLHVQLVKNIGNQELRNLGIDNKYLLYQTSS